MTALLSDAEPGWVRSPPALVAKGGGFSFKPQLSIPSYSPSSPNSELMLKLSRIRPALCKAGISC